MLIKTKFYSMLLDDVTGSLLSFHNGKKEFIHKTSPPSSIFTLRIRDDKGNPADITCFDSRKTSVRSEVTDQSRDIIVVISYENLAGLPISIIIHILCKKSEPFTFWDLSIQNLSDYFVDCIDFPNVIVPNDLVATGGTSRILWSGMEGALIDDMELRENSW
ncbi:hypothetical protein JW926_16455, partial [Candidatus Sumerlaeota bacterium]|nr:hypothetical protein [Candidatus Sumerlaeota bacterium]